MNITKLACALAAYENDELDDQETVELFDQLVATGFIYELQGSYRRQAMRLIEAGLIGVPSG